MKKITLLLLTILCLTNYNCVSQNLKQICKSGFVNQKDYITEIPFEYNKKHIFIKVNISNKEYNFIFDTGAAVTLIDQEISKEIEYTFKKEGEASGSSISAQKNALIELPKVSISNIIFENTYGMLLDLNFIKKDYENLKIDGVIGNNLMRKANWQIDFKNKVIRFTDKIDLSSRDHKKVEMHKENYGLSYLDIEINNTKHKFIFDTGSSGRFTANSSFVGNLKEEQKNSQEAKQTFKLEKIRIGEIELTNQTISLEKGVSSLIGNGFFEDYLLTIDWKKNILYLLPNQ